MYKLIYKIMAEKEKQIFLDPEDQAISIKKGQFKFKF